MKRWIAAASALAVFAACAAAPAVQDDGEETPTIKEIMKKLHKGADAPLARLKGDLKSDSPEWGNVQDRAKLFATLGASLPKNEPPKGEKADFEKLAKAYAEYAKKLDDAARAEDLESARAAFNKLSTSCKTCHTAHRP